MNMFLCALQTHRNMQGSLARSKTIDHTTPLHAREISRTRIEALWVGATTSQKKCGHFPNISRRLACERQ